jgi:hypothetical protein
MGKDPVGILCCGRVLNFTRLGLNAIVASCAKFGLNAIVASCSVATIARQGLDNLSWCPPFS